MPANDRPGTRVMDSSSTRSVASLIDHALLHPTLDDQSLRMGCELAMRLEVATVCVKPYHVSEAADLLAGSSVRVSTVVSFPHGGSPTAVKVAETTMAVRDGAAEIDFVVNVGKVISRDWDFVREDIRAVNDAAVSSGAITKVIFENDFYESDEFIVRLCEICTEVGVAFVKTSTGFGYVRQPDGQFLTRGATDHHVQLMRRHTGSEVQIKASGGIRTLEDVRRLV